MVVIKKNNSWVAQVYLGQGPTGKKQYVSRSAKSMREAQLLEAKLKVEVAEGRRVPSARRTLRDLLAQWMATCDLSPTTRYSYERIIERRLLPALGDTRIEKLTVQRLDEYFASLRNESRADGRSLSPTTIRNIHAVLRSALTQGVRWGWLPSNPAALVRPVRKGTSTVYEITTEKIGHVLSLAQQRDRDLFTILWLTAATGARRSEICGLQWKDLDDEGRRLKISRSVVEAGGRLHLKDTKTHAERWVDLDEETVRLLVAMRDRARARMASCRVILSEEAFIYSGAVDGLQPIRPGVLSARFRKLCRDANVNGLWFHGLRHSAATLLFAEGHNARTVATRLGHADPSTTLRVYAHAVRAADVLAAEGLGRSLMTALSDASQHGVRASSN